MTSSIIKLPLTQTLESRQAFWRGWLGWLANASDAQINTLESTVFAPLAHHVRALPLVMTDALSDPELAPLVPADLLTSLRSAGWPPEEHTAAVMLTTSTALPQLAVA